MLLVKNMLCSKRQCQNGFYLIIFSFPQAPKKSAATPPVVKSKAAAIGIRRQESRRNEADQAAATAQDMLVRDNAKRVQLERF